MHRKKAVQKKIAQGSVKKNFFARTLKKPLFFAKFLLNYLFNKKCIFIKSLKETKLL